MMEYIYIYIYGWTLTFSGKVIPFGVTGYIYIYIAIDIDRYGRYDSLLL